MIYQEINLPIWGQLLLMAILILIGIELAKIKPVEAPKEIKEQIPNNHVKERYGAYIQLRGHYYN
ncbi:MAG: hypothetical protein E7156_09905 [Streptococcus gallolyticus]|jgi:hypothetical protein|uniref:Phage membrane protein n=1 Tax=Streptococcus gallolyticus TaxID=315405 RepID=A0A928A8I7_9STRE|nr:hypothetical protein [Streptococcus gallolyticus]